MITRIYILESIPADEHQTGKELYDDTIVRYCMFYSSPIVHSYFLITSKTQLVNTLNEIEHQVSTDDEIILHIEAHGLDDKTSMSLSNGETITWKELETHLVRINLKIKNKLHLNLVTCFSMHVAEKIGAGLTNTAPYKSFTASIHALNPLDIIEENNLLYEEIIKQQEIYKAYVAFSKMYPNTKMKIKDVEYTLEIIMRMQIERFLRLQADVIMFYNISYNLDIDAVKFNSLPTDADKSNYVFQLFGDKYFPDRLP